jgi:hypothetical protein
VTFAIEPVVKVIGIACRSHRRKLTARIAVS